MVIVDTREHAVAIVRILAEFDRRGVKYVRSALPFADYFNPDMPDVVIDRKQSLIEVAKNLTDGKDKKRFIREIERCNRAGYRMIVLVEHGNSVKRIEDVAEWHNPRLKVSPLAATGQRLFRLMKAFEHYYGIEWVFCNKQSTGRKIIELLGVEPDE